MIIIDTVERMMNNQKYQVGNLILTRSQKAHNTMFLGISPEAWDKFVKGMQDSDKYQVIYQNDDAIIFELSSKPNPVE